MFQQSRFKKITALGSGLILVNPLSRGRKEAIF